MGIRFVDLNEGLGVFAIYDTTIDRFLAYNENQTWTRFESFERDYWADPTTVKCSDSFLNYVKTHCPDWALPHGAHKMP